MLGRVPQVWVGEMPWNRGEGKDDGISGCDKRIRLCQGLREGSRWA